MAFDFPSSPIIGQQFTPIVGGPTYAWNGYAWSIRPALVTPGTLVEISRQTVTSAVASVNFTSGIDATYDEYEIHFYNVRPATEQSMLFQISQDGGATWKTDANYQYGGFSVGATGSPAWLQTLASGGGIASYPSVTAAANGTQNGIVKFWRPDLNQFNEFMTDSVSHYSANSFTRISAVSCYVGNTNGFNALRFVIAGGYNITQGTFVLYGRSKTPVVLAPGVPVLLQTIDMNGKTLIDLPFGTTYDSYEIDGLWLTNATSGPPLLRCSVDGGATFISGTNAYFTALRQLYVSASAPGWANAGFTGTHMQFGSGFGPSNQSPLAFNIKVRRPTFVFPVNVPRLFDIRAEGFDGTNQTLTDATGQLFSSWAPITHARLATVNAVTMQAGSYVKLYGIP